MIGKIYFDDRNIPIEQKINAAARAFRVEFGHDADLVLISSAQAPESEVKTDVPYRAYPRVFVDCLWAVYDQGNISQSQS